MPNPPVDSSLEEKVPKEAIRELALFIPDWRAEDSEGAKTYREWAKDALEELASQGLISFQARSDEVVVVVSENERLRIVDTLAHSPACSMVQFSDNGCDCGYSTLRSKLSTALESE